MTEPDTSTEQVGPRFMERPGLPDAFQEEPGTAAWRKSLGMAAQLREQDARERRDERRSTLSHGRRERRSRRRNLQLAKPGPQKVAAQAALDEIEAQITRDRAGLRQAEHILSRYTPREPRHETSRPRAPSRSHAPLARRVLPRRTPVARAAARRPGCRRTTGAGAARGDPHRDEGDGDPPGPVARLRRWLDSRRDPWRVREAPLGLWRIRAEYVRLAARARRLP